MAISDFDIELLVLDDKFDICGIIDVYQSFVWTDRYQEAGTVEVVVPATTEMLSIVKLDRYLVNKSSDRAMIIDEIKLESESAFGNIMTITGRGIETLLERRIVWNRVKGTDVDNKVNLQAAIKQILNENCISPSNGDRKIPHLVFKDSTDPNVTQHYMNEDHWGDNIYELICNQCKYHNIGWRILPSLDGVFTFELYYGTNRSWSQDTNPWVVFSPSFDNFLNSNYYVTKKGHATVALGVGAKEKTVDQYERETVLPNVTVTIERDGGAKSGLDRYEIAVDCTDIVSYKSKDDTKNQADGADVEEKQISYEDMHASLVEQITAKTKSELYSHGATEDFDGEVEVTQQFVYGKDFFIGDVVQLQNGYGMEAVARVSEVLITYDGSGFSVVPTFTSISNESDPD